MGIHYNQGAELMDGVLNKDDFRFHDGYMPPPTKPGLGVEVQRGTGYRAESQCPRLAQSGVASCRWGGGRMID